MRDGLRTIRAVEGATTTVATTLEALDAPAINKPHLKQLEQIVRDGLQSFLAVGLALIEIRETRGYALRGFDTFEDYCQEAFGFTARHGRRMMQAARTAAEVAGATGDRVRSEGVARALAPIAYDPDAIRHVKARLEARGRTLGNAPAAAIAGILGECLANPPKRTVPFEKQQAGECPACEMVPRAYRSVEGIWQCGNCGAEVDIIARLPKEKHDPPP